MSMRTYSLHKDRKRHRRWPYVLVAPFVLMLATSLIGGPYARDNQVPQPAQTISNHLDTPNVVATPAHEKITAPLSWPDYGQAAYGVTNGGVLAQSDNSVEPVPIASLAKVITALIILEEKPLAPGEQGPMIRLTEADEELYREYVRKDGTVIPVKAGVQLSQYQLLQAMLLPSANNMADTLAIWGFGSVENYTQRANQRLKELGFTKTRVDDASGYSALSVSTAEEMVEIGILYVKHPVLMEIVHQTEADIPFAGRVPSYHATINDGQQLGIKIGYTEAAGTTFLAAELNGDNPDDISVAAVLGADNQYTLIQDIKALLRVGSREHERMPEEH